MSRRDDTLRAGTPFALAAYPPGKHLPFRIVARLPAPWTVVGVGAAAIGMQRLQHEAALFRIAGNDQSRDRRKCPLRFLVAPRVAALRNGCKTDLARRMAIAALDVAFAGIGEHRLHAGAEKVEVE